jgi:hypothetical protein
LISAFDIVALMGGGCFIDRATQLAEAAAARAAASAPTADCATIGRFSQQKPPKIRSILRETRRKAGR